MQNRAVNYITELSSEIKGSGSVFLAYGGLFLAVLGAIYQGVMLIKFGGLYYFSVSQLLTDALILLVFSSPFILGFIPGKLLSLSLARHNKLRSGISVILYIIILFLVFWLTSIYQLILNDSAILMITFLVGVGSGIVFDRFGIQYLLFFLLIFGIAFSFLNSVLSPFRLDRMIILSDGFNGQYELIYQNDKYLFVTNKQDSKPMIISSANLEYYIISNKPNISFQIAKYALDKMLE